MSRYLSYCMVCIAQTGTKMLTGYSIWNERCARCDRLSDLALVDTLRDHSMWPREMVEAARLRRDYKRALRRQEAADGTPVSPR